MAPHGGLFVLLIPGAITPVLGYLEQLLPVRWWRVWRMPSETSGSGRSSESSVIKGVLTGQKFPAVLLG
ncbi:hypothetical protein ACLB1O_05285 [Escherichia coli]